MEEVVIRYVHFIGIFVLASAIVSEHLLISKITPRENFQKLLIVDRIYGLSAIVVLVAGFLLWTTVGKPAAFYSSNPVFHTKITLFVVIAILSIAPTLFFLRNRKNTSAEIAVPKYIIHLLRAQLLLLLVLPFLAVLVSRGVGL